MALGDSALQDKLGLRPYITRGGTYSSIFLNIGDTFDPQVVLGVVLCIKNEIIF